MSVFIRGLWGDAQMAKWPKSMADAAGNIIKGCHPIGTTTYVYGEANQLFLGWLRCKATLMGSAPVQSWGRPGDRNPSQGNKSRNRGHENWGMTTWRHKLEIIRSAVEIFGEVVWLDWDCHLLKPLPGDFWHQMRRGASLQCALIHLPGRILNRWRVDSDDPTNYRASFSHHGAFIYCRDIEIVNRLIQISDEHPQEIDEQHIARWIEEQWGGWTSSSPKRWVDEGYDPYCYGHYMQWRRTEGPTFREGKAY